MFYVIAVILILLCATVIAVMVLRKFPQLTIINTEHLPQERNARKKKAIIDERVNRITGAFGRRVSALLTKAFNALRERFRAAYRHVLSWERQLTKEKEKRLVRPEEQDERITVLMNEAEQFAENEEYGEAEKRYIDVLTIEKRNVEAYYGLGAVYFKWKRYDQAKETYGFLGRMLQMRARCTHSENGERAEGRPCEASAQAHAEMADCAVEAGLAAQQAGERGEARIAFERAVAFAPSNPRHLDLLIDECILEGDKARALQVFGQLQQANAENRKLGQIAERIHAMPT